MNQYRYTILKQDGTKEVLPLTNKKRFDGKDGLYQLLNCSTIEVIPADYYRGLGFGHCTMFGDEEGRFNTNNKANPHFNNFGDDWNVVGDIVMEEVA